MKKVLRYSLSKFSPSVTCSTPVFENADFVKALEGEWVSQEGLTVNFDFDNETEWRFTSEWEKDGEKWWGASIFLNEHIVTSLLPDFDCEPVTCGVVSYLKQHNTMMAYWTEKGFIKEWPATGVALNSKNTSFEGVWDMNYLFYGVDESPGNLFQAILIERTETDEEVFDLGWTDTIDDPNDENIAWNLKGFGVEVEDNVLCAAWGSPEESEQEKMGLAVLKNSLLVEDNVLIGYCVCGEDKEINQLVLKKK